MTAKTRRLRSISKTTLNPGQRKARKYQAGTRVVHHYTVISGLEGDTRSNENRQVDREQNQMNGKWNPALKEERFQWNNWDDMLTGICLKLEHGAHAAEFQQGRGAPEFQK